MARKPALILHYPFKLISKDNERIRNRAGRYFVSAKYRDFEAKVRLYTRQQYRGDPLREGVKLSIIAYFKDKRHGDVQNLFKGVCDALQGYVYISDRQIQEAKIERVYGEREGFEVIIVG